MRHLPQEEHADLGIVPDSDLTEDLRPNSRTAPETQARQRSEGAVPTSPITKSERHF